MSFTKSNINPPYQNIIKDYITQKELFIDKVRDALNKQTPNQEERRHRLNTFNSLLLKATYSKQTDLEQALANNFPSAADPTIKYICENLQEIHGFCTQTFSDEHAGYQKIYKAIKFLTPDIKQGVRKQLSNELITMLFHQTHTAPKNGLEI